MNKLIEAGRSTAIDTWTKVCTVVPEGGEVQASQGALGDMVGLSRSRVSSGFGLFRPLGMMKLRAVYELRKQTTFYSRLVSEAEGLRRINEHFDAGRGLEWYEATGSRKKAAPKAAPKVESVVAAAETVAIVGPDAPAPMAALKEVRKDEPDALIEAARQYANRTAAISAKLAELEALGISVDHAAFTASIKLDTDPVLDAVASLLPSIDRMVRTVERLSAYESELREETKRLRRENADMERVASQLREANRRLSERNTKLSGQLANGGSYASA